LLLTTNPDARKRDRWAQLRFSIIGPLLAAPPPEGELQQALQALAAKTWRHPHSGLDVRFGVSTLERWYYAARRAQDPVAALKDRLRGDCGGFPSVTAALVEHLAAQYRAHPGWTAQLHYDNLAAALPGQTLPSYTTVRRYLKARGLWRRSAPRRATDGALAARDHLEHFEVRSFEMDHVGALWHLDFHHGSRKVLGRNGQWLKPFLLGVIDDRSRLVCHLQWYADETAESLVHGLCQAFMKRHLPRALMTDNGAAMLAGEVAAGLDELGILHRTTLPYSPYQNAKQESFWARVESRLMAMLEGEPALSLDLLNQSTQAWVEQEYHRTRHSEIDATPLERYLAGPDVGRACPSADTLRAAFRIEVWRRQRKSDGTVNLGGCRFEVPSRYRSLAQLHLRYARWDLSRVDLVDARTGTVLCAVLPQDKSANADGLRRAIETPAAAPVTDAGIAPLLRRLLSDYAATGLPPAYLPKEPE
jgi:putative transposase